MEDRGHGFGAQREVLSGFRQDNSLLIFHDNARHRVHCRDVMRFIQFSFVLMLHDSTLIFSQSKIDALDKRAMEGFTHCHTGDYRRRTGREQSVSQCSAGIPAWHPAQAPAEPCSDSISRVFQPAGATMQARSALPRPADKNVGGTEFEQGSAGTCRSRMLGRNACATVGSTRALEHRPLTDS